ncbi:hypothetical protein, partial [Escherichia coli]|uniref:hypothetical protein n=1 Tax=Escherichia coli TaxID=562 RepID=UPI00195493EA
VHAAWIAVDIEFLKDFTQPDGVLLDEAFPDALQKSTLVGDILERLLKGPEHPLPRSLRYVDKDGIGRRRSRVRWWDPNPTTLNDA